jgi:putative isomerase
MSVEIHSPLLLELENQIDISHEPFSDRGSRILVSAASMGIRIDIAIRSARIRFTGERSADAWASSLLIQLVNDKGDVLDFTVRSYPHLLQLETGCGPFQLAFQDLKTIAIGLPANQKCGIVLKAQNRPSGGKAFSAEQPVILNLTAASTSPLVNEPHRSKGLPHQLSLLTHSGEDDAILIHIAEDTRDSIQPEAFSIIKARAEAKWHQWFSAVPEVRGRYRQKYYFAWWVLANNLVSPRKYLGFEGIMPSKAKYIGVWNWDSCFHALGLRHLDIGLARDQLRLILSHQLDNGMLPDAIFDHGVVSWIDHPLAGDVTKPPLIAWAAVKLHRDDPDLAYLEEIYPQLCRWNQWWFSHLDSSGLPQYTHPYSSGLDDSPLWDHPFPITSPDLITYLVIQMQSLAYIAELLGLPGQAASWEDRCARLVEGMIAGLYNRDLGTFTARNSEMVIDERTPFGILPLWTNLLPSDIQERLVLKLTQGGEFWKVHPLQTVSSSSANFSPDIMWRGPVWINVNFLFIEALQTVGRMELAARLTEETLELVNSCRGIYEYYNPESGLPPKAAAPAYSWSAALFIDLVLRAQKGQAAAHSRL